MTFTETDLPGVIVVEPKLFPDPRGYFFESYNERRFSAAGIVCHFIQDNQSKSRYGVIRGLHCQLAEHAQAKLMRVLHGAILDVAVDIRHNSPTFGKYIAIELSDTNHKQLFVPRGFLHGFSVLSETAVLHYKCDNLYNPHAEAGVRHDDPVLGIDWRIPADKIIVSEKDSHLRDFRHVAHHRE